MSILHAINREQPERFATEAPSPQISLEQLTAAAISEAALERLGDPKSDAN